jgi:shikimate dehydrogenase
MQITGATRFIAHIGYPTTTFRAPMIYNPYFRAKGIDVVIVPMGCEAEGFTDLVRALSHTTNCLGSLVTMPNKIIAAGLADEMSTTVDICGAANALKFADEGRMRAGMFDGEGFVRGLERKGRKLSGASVYLAGAGGVGSAIAASVAGRGAGRIAIRDASADRAEDLKRRLLAHYPRTLVEIVTEISSDFDVVINATPLGMKADDPLPIDTDRISAQAIVGDVVLSEAMTPLLRSAASRGCAVQVGLDMLFEQIPAYLEFFDLPATTSDELRALSALPDSDRLGA